MGLELRQVVELLLAELVWLHREADDAATLVSYREDVPGSVEGHRREEVGSGDCRRVRLAQGLHREHVKRLDHLCSAAANGTEGVVARVARGRERLASRGLG